MEGEQSLHVTSSGESACSTHEDASTLQSVREIRRNDHDYCSGYQDRSVERDNAGIVLGTCVWGD